MDVLLDTCAFLYLCHDDVRLGPTARRVILNPHNHCLLSIASAWEIAIKSSLNRDLHKRIVLSKPLDVFLNQYLALYRIDLVPIDIPHLLHVNTMPQHHPDPFDRLIVAQALTLSVPIVTNDPKFGDFGVEIIW